MKGKKIGILIGVSAVVVAVGASVTVTQQNEYKLIRQFGKVDRVISSSGVHSHCQRKHCCMIWQHLM